MWLRKPKRSAYVWKSSQIIPTILVLSFKGIVVSVFLYLYNVQADILVLMIPGSLDCARSGASHYVHTHKPAYLTSFSLIYRYICLNIFMMVIMSVNINYYTMVFADSYCETQLSIVIFPCFHLPSFWACSISIEVSKNTLQ